MTTFKLDTSGFVDMAQFGELHHWTGKPWTETTISWPDLSPFVQGYVAGVIEAINFDIVQIALSVGAQEEPQPYGFSDLAPATLARIMEDCERFQDVKHPSGRALLQQSYSWGDLWREAGANFWLGRQRFVAFDSTDRGAWTEEYAEILLLAAYNFPPLTPYLGDDGKLRFTD